MPEERVLLIKGQLLTNTLDYIVPAVHEINN